MGRSLECARYPMNDSHMRLELLISIVIVYVYICWITRMVWNGKKEHREEIRDGTRQRSKEDHLLKTVLHWSGVI